VRYLDTSPGDGSVYDERWDLSPGASFPFTKYINIQDITTLTNGSTGYPPMFGGLTAFGRSCTPDP
jgi:hypothetical protein